MQPRPLITIAAQITHHLPGEWQAHPGRHESAALLWSEADQHEIYLYRRDGRYHLYAGGVSVFSQRHGLERCPQPQPSITCSPHRSAQSIARDIQHRLLPNARDYWQAGDAWLQERQAQLAQDEETRAALVKASGRQQSANSSAICGDSWRAQITSYGTVTLQFDALVPKKALALLHAFTDGLSYAAILADIRAGNMDAYDVIEACIAEHCERQGGRICLQCGQPIDDPGPYQMSCLRCQEIAAAF